MWTELRPLFTKVVQSDMQACPKAGAAVSAHLARMEEASMQVLGCLSRMADAGLSR